MICFKTIRWKNLLSYGNLFTEIRLDSHPTTLVLGKNGSGKSTLLDALCYVLFKKPFRKINKDQLVNTINNGDCLIEVEFEIGTVQYKVVRGIKPDVFEVYVNGSKRLQEAARKDDQAYLVEDVLKVNYEAFTQVVILGNAKYTPFMQLTTPKRREFIEHILDIGVFSTMNDILSSRQKTLKTELDGISGDMSMVQEQMTLVEGFIARLQEDASRATDEIRAKIDQGNDAAEELIRGVDDLTTKIDSLAETIQDKDTIVDKLKLFEDGERRIQSLIQSARNTIRFYADNDTCKTCRQSIEYNHRQTIITDSERLIAEHETRLEQIGAKRETNRNRLAEIDAVSKQIQALDLQWQHKGNNIRAIRTYVKKLELDLKKKPGNVQEQEDKLVDLREKYSRLETQKQECIERRHYYDVASVLLKDTGVKSAIIRQYLPAINRQVNKYLADLDFFLSFSLDQGFNETFKSRFRDAFTYYSFSEGQKLRIDLSLLFAWRDVARLKNSCSTNLLILDEVIDKSLDEEGTDYVIKLIHDLSQQSNVIVISHKNEAALDMFTNIIRFSVHGNFSHRIAA